MNGGDRSTAMVSRRSFLRTAGGATAVAATAGAAAGQDETTTEGGTTTGNGTTTGEGTPADGTETDGTATTTGGDGGDGGEPAQTVEMTDQLVFDPEEVTVAPGDTVEWVNVGQVEHSVTAYEEEIPDGAEYFASGGFESEQAARDAYPEGAIGADESYSHTFETAGEFGYFCIPHESVGMVGTVVVQEGGGGGGDGEAAAAPSIPDTAKTLGIISVSAMASVLALAYVFLKYGGDYGEVEA